MHHYYSLYNDINITHTLMVEHQLAAYCKQLEYVTKDYIAMSSVLFKLKMALFFSSLVV